MNDIFIHHHMGLGDHLLCFGLIRELSKNYNKIYLFCFPKYEKSVKFLYKNEEKIEIIPLEEKFIGQYVIENQFCENKNILTIGFDKSRELQTKMSFDEAFYYTQNVDFKKKYKNFKIDRDLKSEKKLFQRYNLSEGDYIFVHDDRDRGYNINIYGDNVVRPNFIFSENIFDYLYIIENAKEVHCIDSCFFIMIDFIIEHDKLFYHINARGDYSLMFPNQGGGVFAHPRYQKDWQIIK